MLVAGGATRFALARDLPPGRVEAGVANKGFPALNQARDLCTIRFVLENPLPPGYPSYDDLSANGWLPKATQNLPAHRKSCA